MLKPISTIGFVALKTGQMLFWAIDMIVLDVKLGVAIWTIDMFNIRQKTVLKIKTSGAPKGTMNMGVIYLKLSFCLFSEYLIISYLIPSVH